MFSRRALIGGGALALAWGLSTDFQKPLEEASADSRRQLNGVELIYPAPATGQAQYTYFGETFRNEYEAFEVDDSTVARSFVAEQNALTRRVLDGAPRRAEVREIFSSFAASVAPIPRFFNGLTYVIEANGIFQVGEDGAKTRIVDIAGIHDQTRSFDPVTDRPAIKDFSVSPDSRFLAVVVAFNDRDFGAKIYLVERATAKVRGGEILEKALNYTPVFGTYNSTAPVWSSDSSYFIYTQLLTNRDITGSREIALAPHGTRLVKHRVGTSASADEVVFERPRTGAMNEIIQVLPAPGADQFFVTMFNTFYVPNFFGRLNARTKEIRYYQSAARLYADHHLGFLGQAGDFLYFRTDRQAPNGAIIKLRSDDFNLTRAVVIVPGEESPIESAFLARDHLFIVRIKDLAHRWEVRDLNGALITEPVLPGKGSLSGFTFDPRNGRVYFGYSDYTTPRTLLAYEMASRTLHVLDRPAVRFAPERFVVSTGRIVARDGAVIPTTEIHRAGADPRAPRPTYLYFYGNLAAAVLPTFNATTNKFLAFVELGGRVVIAHVRGGTEVGGGWAYAGARLNKMNTLTDVIDVAETLIKAGRTRASQIVLSGRSSAGFAAAAAMLVSPSSFGMLTTVVPLADMLRYHEFTCGTRWEVEYGLSTNREDFDILKRLSPIHISRRGQWIPPTIIFSAERDDRVPSHHAMKLAATLQTNSGRANPVLFYEEPLASHAARAEGVDELTFATLVIPW